MPLVDSPDKTYVDTITIVNNETGKSSTVSIFSGTLVQILAATKDFLDDTQRIHSLLKKYQDQNVQPKGLLLLKGEALSLNTLNDAFTGYTNNQRNELEFGMKWELIPEEGILIFMDQQHSGPVGTIHDKVHSNIKAILLRLTKENRYTLK